MRNLLFACVVIFVGFHSNSFASSPNADVDGQILQYASKNIRDKLLKHPNLVHEATLYLTSCRLQSSKDDIDYCRYNRIRFLVEYVDAFYNHITAQENVAFDLAGDGGTSMPMPGIWPNHVQSCAWRLAILGSGGPGVGSDDETFARGDCSGLSVALRHVAEARAAAIAREIRKHLADGSSAVSMDDTYK